MAEINLLQPQRKRAYQLPSSLRSSSPVLLWVVIGLVVIELGAWGFLYYWRGQVESEVQIVESEIIELDGKISKRKADAADAIVAQSALLTLEKLLDQHVYFTKVWEELRKTALKKADYLGLQATIEQNKFFITGQVGTYTELGKVLLGLETSGFFEHVDLLSSGSAEGEVVAVAFEVEVSVDPALLIVEKED